MNIFLKLQELVKLTDSEEKLVEYICAYPEDVINMDIMVLCEKAFVSKPTVYRLCKKAGIKGYSDLKVLMARDISHEKDDEVDYNYPFKNQQTHYQIVEGMSDVYHQTIQDTKDLLDLEVLRVIVQELLKAKNIKVFPSVGNVFMAKSFQQNMQEIGVMVDVAEGIYDQHWSACASDEQDVVIVISYLGKTDKLEGLMQTLKKQKVKLVLISAIYEETLSKYADYRLHFCSSEHFQEKVASFSSRVSLQYLLDCIYSCYFNRSYEKNMKYKITNYIDN